MPKIARVQARQILDSRSFPTIEVSVTLDSGISAYSSAPSGGIVNKAEAHELRDQNPSEYFGLGVSKAVQFVNSEVSAKLIGMDPLYQNQIDQALVDLDGTPNKARIGGNSILATSQAVMKTAALSLNLPLFVYIKEKYRLVQDFRVPTPIFNLINGGRHGSGSLDFQEFQVVPASHLPYRQALRIGVEIFLALERVLEQKGAIRAVGLEGGFSPNLATNTDALEILFEACQATAYTLSKDAFLGVDASPQNFQKGGRFIIRDKNEPLTSKQLIQFYKDLHSQFRVFAFEDALLPDAWADWKSLTAELGATAMILADDLIATNKTLLLKAIEERACNALVVKPNRAGTVTETVEAVSLAKQANWHTIMSHRSGETNDDFAADLAVGLGTDYVKFGATSRGERVEKYNRLLRIQEQLEEWQGTAAPSQTTEPAASFETQSATPTNADTEPQQTGAPVSAPQSAAPDKGSEAPATDISIPTSLTSEPLPAQPKIEVKFEETKEISIDAPAVKPAGVALDAVVAPDTAVAPVPPTTPMAAEPQSTVNTQPTNVPQDNEAQDSLNQILSGIPAQESSGPQPSSSEPAPPAPISSPPPIQPLENSSGLQPPTPPKTA